jgi:hypothetical protein
MTDTERIDLLEILRLSSTGRGWRLHETEKTDGYPTVREAIDNFDIGKE